MKPLINIKTFITQGIFILMIVLCTKIYAQSDSLDKAQKLCNEKKYVEAISLLDNVISNPETKNNPHTWHMRSYAYLQAFKLSGNSNISKVNLLDTSMSSALRSIKLDVDSSKPYLEHNHAFIKNGAALYYKLSTILLQDSLNDIKSEKLYLKYKSLTKIINSDFDFKARDIEYYNTMGSIFADLYMKNNFNQKQGEIAKKSLLKVLEIDEKNISANINLGILYYNQGATLMRMMDYDVDLAQLDIIQENAKKLFKQSLPFMIKVYELDPNTEKALESLEGIYSALLDDEKANEFKQKKEALNKK